jgi:hypothetical protein
MEILGFTKAEATSRSSSPPAEPLERGPVEAWGEAEPTVASPPRPSDPADLAAGGLILDEAAAVVESGLAPLSFPDEPKKAEVAPKGSDENAAQITEASVLELLNAGSKPELQTLRLIGEQRAEMIVQFREKHGPLTSIDQLNEIGLKAFKPRAFLDANLKHGVPLTTTIC